ncbi:hypothetical protein NE865_07715 [Phthorimaea operculella]|nr:hypothetical protein NE865_07715 [Phthorimaea operculella]
MEFHQEASIASINYSNDFVCLQEHWLIPDDLDFINTIDEDFLYSGSSAVDTSAGPLIGRPYGGVAVMWRKSRFPNVTPINTGSTRIAAVRVSVTERNFIVMSVYMPCDCAANLPLFTECLGIISAIIENSDTECVIVLGDYNANLAKVNSLFGTELMDYCKEQNWVCADYSLLLGTAPNTFTYRSNAHGTTSWLDHCIVTSAAMNLVTKISVINDVNWSDHFPLVVNLNIDVIVPKINLKPNKVNKVIWGNRDPSQIDRYNELCNKYLKSVMCPEFICTANVMLQTAPVVGRKSNPNSPPSLGHPPRARLRRLSRAIHARST